MNITDELRNWFKARRFMGYGWQEIYSIADRIDAEYQKVIRERNDFADELSDFDETSVVEDVLLEACKEYHSLMIEGMSDVAHDMPAPSDIIAKYAAKLRLAEDGEER